jgi:hypothetical protein
MTTNEQTAQQIAIEAGVLVFCPSCGGVHQTGADPVQAYKQANLEFSQGRHAAFPDRRALTDAVKSAIDDANGCACGSPAPAQPPTETRTMNDTTPKTLRDLALNSVPAALREPLLTLAAQHHIASPDDPFWTIVAATANAMSAAQAAGEAATRVHASVQEIPSAIADGASKAATDVKAIIEASISTTVKTSLDQAVTAGAATLRQAASDLPKVGRDNQAAIVSEWKAALSDAVRRHTWTGFLQRLSVSVALAGLLVGGVFVGGVFAGGKGMLFVVSAKHRLVPASWALEVGKNGKPLCGAFAGRDVCLARPVTKPAT